jgi:hypothetical protein
MSAMVGGAIVGVVVLAAYAVLLALTKVVTAEDAARFPGPLQKVLRKFVKNPKPSNG